MSPLDFFTAEDAAGEPSESTSSADDLSKSTVAEPAVAEGSDEADSVPSTADSPAPAASLQSADQPPPESLSGGQWCFENMEDFAQWSKS